MATTTNYSWSTPDNTAYVKDGASAIRTLGSSVDTTLYTALGGAYPGLRLIKKQTIGSAVSSVIVTSAFSATYANYLIAVSDVACSSANDSIGVQMRTGSTTSTTLYNFGLIYVTYAGTVSNSVISNGASWNNVGRGLSATDKVSFGFDLFSPFLASKTLIAVKGTTGSDLTGISTGFHNTATSYDQFVLNSSSGTMTGGTIYVYGYGAS
jgi:hypothetical protein